MDYDFNHFIRERCHTWPTDPSSITDHHDQFQSHEHYSSSIPSGRSLVCDTSDTLVSAVWQNGSELAMEDDGDSGNVGSVGNTRCNQPTPIYKSPHPSYVELITQVINSSPEKRMTLGEIYDWMVANVPSFSGLRHQHSSAGWKNSVRHNLSLHARFKRVKRNGMEKPSWWTVDLMEEAKRIRNKRPRQLRPRANTTTATSREYQHRQCCPAVPSSGLDWGQCNGMDNGQYNGIPPVQPVTPPALMLESISPSSTPSVPCMGQMSCQWANAVHAFGHNTQDKRAVNMETMGHVSMQTCQPIQHHHQFDQHVNPAVQSNQTTGWNEEWSFLANSGKDQPSFSTDQLPDDLASLEVAGGLECDIMDVISYEMSTGTGFL